jgi:hypothetical protein
MFLFFSLPLPVDRYEKAGEGMIPSPSMPLAEVACKNLLLFMQANLTSYYDLT